MSRYRLGVVANSSHAPSSPSLMEKYSAYRASCFFQVHRLLNLYSTSYTGCRNWNPAFPDSGGACFNQRIRWCSSPTVQGRAEHSAGRFGSRHSLALRCDSARDLPIICASFLRNSLSLQGCTKDTFARLQYPVPPLYRAAAGIFTTILARLALLFMGFYWIPVALTPRKRG